VDKITEGTHERVVIDSGRFAARLTEKARGASPR
jgi:predicted thioesterase